MTVTVACIGGLVSAENRNQRQDGDGRHVLEQQDGEGGLSAGSAHQIALGHDLQADSGRRQCQAHARNQADAPGQTKGPGSQEQNAGADRHLRHAPAEDGAAQLPEALGLQLKSDHEQHQHHAKLGKMQDVVHIAHQTKAPGAHGNAGAQIADDGSQAQGSGDGDSQNRRRKIDEAVSQPDGRAVFHGNVMWC